MDYEQQVRRASGGDVKAFVDLTRQFQHMAFGAALALVNDFHQAEDVVQEAFVAAWSALPSLADPAAFPGWLRGIVRHQAFRVLRKRTLRTVPLAEAEDLPGEELSADRRLEQRQQPVMALAAIAGLFDSLREPATLFFVHECSASGHCGLPRSVSGDGQQPPASRAVKIEGKDADHGDGGVSFPRMT
jgi:RNA polymerase sigma factor (sigma-70 family)